MKTDTNITVSDAEKYGSSHIATGCLLGLGIAFYKASGGKVRASIKEYCSL